MNQILSYGRLCLLLTFALLFNNVQAQKTREQVEKIRKAILDDPKVVDVKMSEERQTPSLIVLEKNNAYTKAQTAAALSDYLDIRPGVDNLLSVKTTRLTANFEVAEYSQYYKGVKVEHGGFKAFIKNGIVQFYNGAWFPVSPNLQTQPLLSEEGALSKAKKRINAKKYAWEEASDLIEKYKSNPAIKAELQKELKEYLPKGELVIVKDFNKKGIAEVKLAYKFNIYAAEPISRAWIYVDAMDGKILLVDKIIKHVDETKNNPQPASVNATVQTRYAGTQTIKTKQISGNDPNSGFLLTSSHPTSEVYIPGTSTYALIDDTRGGGIETYDMNGVGGLPLNVPSLYLQAKSFTDVDNNWSLTEHHRSPANEGAFEAENDDIAWDAHWGAEVVYDYWLAKHNRLSYDGNNASIKSFIHFGPAYDNAFWNGTAMTYGDGSGNAALGFKALTSLDVCGHEIGHGVCSFTADLVYEKESGAMNEALSDIWAACIEHFAMTRSGSTVPSTAYRPFYIGEQIGADANSPLRRMDNPKSKSDPDTYGGQNWVSPDCVPEQNTNDNCGVHTNSGVLNHWFFLLTAGSKNGARPAGFTPGQYYFADSDDEINDLGNAYTVNGLGFDVSEQITFLTETMISSTATYAEFSDVSKQVAIAMSGDPCSALVESVTNAWYACGVGEKFVKPCTITYGFIMQPGAAINEASTPSGCNSEKTFNISLLMPANSTATITATGTATVAQDYTLPVTSLTNNTSSLSKKDFSVVIKNDGIVEQDETIEFTISITNAGSNPVNNKFTITLMDDDVVPVIGNTDKLLLNETFTRADGFADPAGWTEKLEVPEGAADPLATGKNQWGIFDNKLAITGKEGLTGTQFPNGNYNSNSNSKTLIRSSLIDARGLSVLNIKFDYTVQGEVDAQSGGTDIESFPVFDYMAILYSFDGINFTELNTGEFRQFASIVPASGSFAANLPANLTNKQFYLAFRWTNDDNAGGPNSVSIDNLVLKGAPRKIENEVNQNGRENLNAGQEVYFYSNYDSELLGRVKNNSTNNFGCTNLYVEKTGANSFNLYQDRNGLHKVADKVVRIEASSLYKASQTITLYYTEAQLQGLEAATGQSRSAFSIYHVSAASYMLAANNNTKKYAASYTDIPGVGGYYTITFTDKINGSFALGCQVSALGTRSVPGDMVMQGNKEWKFESVYPNPGNGNAVLSLQSPNRQKVLIEVVNLTGQIVYKQAETMNAGSNTIQLKVRSLGSGSFFIRFKDEDGKVLNNQQYHRY